MAANLLDHRPNHKQFRVRDFSTLNGCGHAVIRADWCPTAQRSNVDQHAAHLGIGWHGEDVSVRGFSATHIERLYRARFSVEIDVRRCTCGCLARAS